MAFNILRKNNDAIERDIMLNGGVREQRWKKCTSVADKVNNELHNIEHNFNDEDK
jgi:hypothetical protein